MRKVVSLLALAALVISVAGVGAAADMMSSSSSVSSGPVPGNVQWNNVTQDDVNNPKAGDWPAYGRSQANQRYSPLDDLNRGNVGGLTTVWAATLPFTGGAEASPVEVNGVIYMAGNDNTVTAFDATNGEQLWQYNAKVPDASIINVSRGVAVYDNMVYYNRLDATVVALDAKTGEEVWSTQVADPEVGYSFTSPGVIADGKVVVGTTGADLGGANGMIVALDAETGEKLWTWHVIPKPGEPGSGTWKEPGTWKHGGGSPWNIGSYDAATDTIVWGTGQPNPWLKTLHPGDNLYTDTVVGLDADTGKLKWHHQLTPADTWDYDEEHTNILADITIAGKKRPVAIHQSKTGWLSVIDRKTGEFLTSHQINYANVVQGFDKDGRPKINPAKDVPNVKAGQENLFCPGSLGGSDWMSGAYSPQTGLVYLPTNEECAKMTLHKIEYQKASPYMGADTTYVHAPGYDYVGHFQAVDPATGKVAWEMKTERGWTGGALATGGGIVFSGGMDRVFRAFDAKTGKVLWSQILNTSIESPPITYSVDGRQYVAVAAGCCGGTSGGLASLTPELPFPSTGNAVLWVFTLPENKS